MTRAEQISWSDWVGDTCLQFGTSAATAHKIAAVFLAALERDAKRPRKAGG